MERAVSSLPLCSSWLAKLTLCGYERVNDLKNVGVVELAREIGISDSEALQIIRVAKRTNEDPPTISSDHTHQSSPHFTTLNQTISDTHNISTTLNQTTSDTHNISSYSALELLHREQVQGSIVTFCAAIDGLMGGGVALGKVTELCGAPGLGKTQISIQLAVDVCIPEPLGGVGGEAIYIDTEGSFIIERVAEIAKAAVQHLTNTEDTDNDDEVVRLAVSGLSLETVLSSIHLYRCHDYLELLATIHILPDIIKQHPKVRLLVIDNIAEHFRHGFNDMSKRNRLLNIISQHLIQLATLHNIAVVLTNQMTTKVVRGEHNSAQLVPALGESWGHASTLRVVLFWSDSERKATLYKSPTHKEATVPFVITADGIRDTFQPNESTLTPITASQCVSLHDDFIESDQEEEEEEEGDCYNMTDDINMKDSTVWQDGVEGGGGRESTDPNSDFVSVSSFQNMKTEQERRGRKRPHPSDPEL